MITLHHLNRSRSKRIIWLMEALDIPYEIKSYQRDPKTHLAPPELKKIHLLGKAPVIEENGQVIAESGAIVEYLTEKYGEGKLAPAKDSKQYPLYLQWLHFAESSIALPVLTAYFLGLSKTPNDFLDAYSKKEITAILTYLDEHLGSNKWLLGDDFSSADIMMSFIIETCFAMGLLTNYKNLSNYYTNLMSDSFAKKAADIEKQHDTSISN